jgi:hypothetical protein
MLAIFFNPIQYDALFAHTTDQLDEAGMFIIILYIGSAVNSILQPGHI